VKTVRVSGSDRYGEEWAVSNPWLKVRCIVELTGTPEEVKHLFFHSIYGYGKGIGYF